MTVFAIAALHAVPIMLTGLLTAHRKTITGVAAAMAFAAVAFGGIDYAFFDLLAVASGYLASVRLSRLPTEETP